MKGLGATIAVGILTLSGCGLFGGQLTNPDAGVPEQGGSSTGGAPAATGGSGPATGGRTGTGGLPGTGGAVTTGGVGGAPPACAASVTKGAACADSDVQACTKTCGPERVGTKTETCQASAYVEGLCQFDPSANYACYAVPDAPGPGCPTALIQAGSPCTIPDCIVCGGSTGYLDSTGAMKTGYCVCQAAATNPTWSCALTSAWPCPGGTCCLQVATP
jgi:hypothetical protein